MVVKRRKINIKRRKNILTDVREKFYNIGSLYRKRDFYEDF